MARIEDELLDALSKTKIRGKDWQLITCILKVHNRKEYITLGQFSHRTGMTIGHVCRGLKKLLAKNIILKSVEGEEIYYTINKNHASWTETTTIPVEVIKPKLEDIKVSKLFFEFYNMYPNKVNFLLTKKKWAELNPDDELARHIIERLGIWMQCEAWKKDKGKWIPAAHTFIMYRRWEDEPKTKQGWRK